MTCSLGKCGREPFLHWIHWVHDSEEEIETSFTCTKHVGLLRDLPPVVIDGIVQVHEVEPACLDEESSWNLDENCCVCEHDLEEPVEWLSEPLYRQR